MVNHVPLFLIGEGRGEFLGIVSGNVAKCLAQSKIIKSRNNVREEDVMQKLPTARVSCNCFHWVKDVVFWLRLG